MTPTPLHRPYTISISKRVHWALRILSKALTGNGPLTPENTPDGIANTMLEGVIERNYPGLLSGHAKKEQIDAEYQAMVQLGKKDAQHDMAVIRAKEGKTE